MTTRQKSDRRVVPDDQRKLDGTRDVESRGGGKAASVIETTQQLTLRFEPGEEPQSKRTQEHEAAPVAATMMEEICERLESAFHNVAANKGAHGPDGKSIEEVRKHLPEVLAQLRSALLSGDYEPGNIRRVWIPKAGGGQRGLGIPNVVDRVVQEAVRLVLEPLYEPTFHLSSHGFRPGRSCHTAIAAARQYVEEGFEWVVDLDLEKFFDRVNHQRLMARLGQRVTDRRVLVVISRMLKARVVMPDGVVAATEEGVPQGGPLSPLLSNIVLDELDRELDQRGHFFVRYADDCNIYVRTQRAGERVMANITRFIEKRLRLKVNTSKSAVARPHERHFLGFSLSITGKRVEVWLSKRSKERLAAKIVELTPRTWGNSMSACIKRLNAYLRGWLNYFGICTDRHLSIYLRRADSHIRRRLRAIQIKHWKRKRSIARGLIRLGIGRATAWRRIYEGRRSPWSLSHHAVVDTAMSNGFFSGLGLLSLMELWRVIAAARQRPEQ